MNKTTVLLSFILFYQLSPTVLGIDFQYKKASDFKQLDQFGTVEQFETHYQQYVQTCLDNTGGGTGGIPCFIGNKMWDRELNLYYKKLVSQLNKTQKTALKKSQFAWLKTRDLSLQFNAILINKENQEGGTLGRLIRSGDRDTVLTNMVKQRTLLLKNWVIEIQSYK